MELHQREKMIIDGHAHLYPNESAQYVIDRFTGLHKMEPRGGIGKGTVIDLQDKMMETRTDYTVVANFAPAKGLYKTNEWTLNTCRDSNNLIPLISVHPDMPMDVFEGYFRDGARGVKMHNGIQGFEPTDPGLNAMYNYCSDHNIPITFHCGETSRVHMNEYTDIDHIIEAVSANPDITFVLTHIATGEPEVVEEIAETYQNVLFDTSIVLTGEHCIHRIHNNCWEDDAFAYEFIRRIGCDRFAFGSDYPFGNPVSDIRRIEKMGFNSDELDLILGENTRRLYLSKI